MNTRFATIVVLTSAVAIAGCKPKAPEILPPLATETAAPTQNWQTPQTVGPQVGSQEHFVNAVNGQNVIYFDTDRFNIDNDDIPALQSQAQYLAQNTGVSVTVEGHADERGTREYNLALGERRANAAKNYLVSLGVSANRIRTVSYGKERPVALGSNEQAWEQNRRAVTVVIR